MTQELTVTQGQVGMILPPEIVLENARTAARALADVISNKKKPVIMNGEQYLEFEDWQTAGQFYGYTVRTGEAQPVEVDGVKGAKAHADLIDFRTGMYLGGAEAYCMRDEEHWNTRPKYEWQGKGDDRKRVKVGDEVVPWFQLASMAQTRAGAKAFRNRLAWVVVLAGYRPTPAEEMTEGTVSSAINERRTVDKSEHYYQRHGVNFFKKGKMRSYGHPVEAPPPQDLDSDADKAIEPFTMDGEVVEPAAEEGQTSYIDMQWLKESLAILQKKKVTAWSNTNIVAYLNTLTKTPSMSVVDAVRKLNKEQAADFVAKLEETLAMA